MGRVARSGKVARWAIVDGRAEDQYLAAVADGVPSWVRDVREASRWDWAEACRLARALKGVPLICATRVPGLSPSDVYRQTAVRMGEHD